MKHIYIDERMGPEAGGWYFLGGVALDDAEVEPLAQFVREFKRHLRPDLDPNAWYMKADGKHLVEGREVPDTKAQAFARWETLSSRVGELKDVRYTLHAVTLLKGPFRRRPEIRLLGNGEKAEREMAVAAGVLLGTLALHGPGNWRVVSDHVDDRARNALLAGAWVAASAGEGGRSPARIESVGIAPKDDTASDDAQALQFIDTSIYALSRLIMPAGPRKSILADFERWALSHVRREVPPPDNLQAHVAQYFKIAPLYHHFRSRFLKDYLTRSGKFGSAVLISESEEWNFAHDVDLAAWQLCNTMWEGWTEEQLLIDLTAHL